MSDRRFNTLERQALEDILLHRRDIRGNRFNDQAISDEDLNAILLGAIHAPSVGFSQPWEFVVIRDRATREKIVADFENENRRASEQFSEVKKSQYQQLKLEGILESNLNIAVFYKPSDEPVLGQTSMIEMGEYSVVCAVQNMWLMARSLNIGMGWVSILNVDHVKKILNAPNENKLVAYLCLGHVDEFLATPELEQLQWAKRKTFDSLVHQESFPEALPKQLTE